MVTHEKIKPWALLSGLSAVLTFVAAAAGLFVPDFYQPFMPSTALLLGALAQDLVALLVVGILLGAIILAWRGSVRALPVWGGCLGYLIYAYLLWAFEAIYTSLFPAYIAILSLSLFSLLGLLGQFNADDFRRHVSPSLPARLTAVVVALPALMAPPWILFMLEGVSTGTPVSINSVLVIDLTFIVPASLVTSVLLWRRRTWGFIFAGPLLVLMTIMSATLIIGTIWGASLGTPIDPVWPLYLAMTLLGGVSLGRYLQHIGRSSDSLSETAALVYGR